MANPIPIVFPLGGLNESAAYASQPGKFILHVDHVLNMRPHDALERRARGGQRTGIGKFLANAVSASAVQNMAQAVEAVALTESAGFGNKYADPSSLPTGTSTVAWHPDGDRIAVASYTGTTLTVRVYTWDDVSGWGTADASTTLSFTSAGYVAWNPTGSHLLLTISGSDTIRVYPYTKNVGFGTVQSFDISSVGLGGGGGVSSVVGWHPDGDVIFFKGGATNADRQLSAVNWTGSAFGSVIGTSPQIGTNGAITSLAPNSDGSYIAATSSASTASYPVGAISFDKVSGWGTWSLQAPGSSISAKLCKWALDDSGFFAAGRYATHLRLEFYPVSLGVVSAASAEVAISSDGDSSSTIADLKLSHNGNYIAVAYSSTPYIKVWPWSGAFGTILSNPATLPAGAGISASWHPLDTGIVVGHVTSPYVSAYEFNAERVNPSARKTRLVAVQGGNVYRSNYPPTALTLSNSGSGVLVSSGIVRSSPAFQKLFFVDGVAANYCYLDYADNTVHDWATNLTAGALPVGTDDTALGCQIIALYRGRVVLAGLREEPQNWFMSRSGDPFDFDYSPATTDAIQAVAGNNSNVGELGDVLTALAPFQDDVMIMGGANSLWIMRGDPAAGGQIDNISRQIGIIGPEAFCWAPGGVMYFMGRNGLYRLSPDGTPDLVSKDKLDKTFSAIDYTAYRISMVYDTEWQGVHIFLIPFTQPDAGAEPKHYWWDERTGGFWPDKYPNSTGPTAILTYAADNPEESGVLLGGWDGYIRQFDPATNNDDGTAIDSYVRFPILHPNLPMGQFQLEDLQINLGDSTANGATLDIYRGHTPQEAALATTAAFTKALVAGRNLPIRKRLRGNALQMRLRNNSAGESWAYENGTALILGVGRMRAKL